MPPSRPVFTLTPSCVNLSLPSTETITAAAASGGLLWVGTSQGRILRHDTQTKTTTAPARLGATRSDNAIRAIFASARTRHALVILRNADGYHAHASGPLRPRWLAKLRGLSCRSAFWIPGTSKRESVLLGTEFGAVFLLSLDAHEKNDSLTKLWSVPGGAAIDGLRVEFVAGGYVTVVATAERMFVFSGARSVRGMFGVEGVEIEAGEGDIGGGVKTELYFMTGASGGASRRFVWAERGGVSHARLALRRHREADVTSAEDNSDQQSYSSTSTSVVATIADRETISWKMIRESSQSAAPICCNITAYHVLLLYPSFILAYNHISNTLTQHTTLWDAATCDTSTNASSLLARREKWNDEISVSKQDGEQYLKCPAAGMMRDAHADVVWIYTCEGSFYRFVATREEALEAWKAARMMRRYDVAMALAPLVTDVGRETEGIGMLQTREMVLEMQADDAVMRGEWDVAARLFAKTQRTIESVLLQMVGSQASKRKAGRCEDILNGLSGGGDRLEYTGHMVTYLVGKLDCISRDKPMQRTIVACLLIQLYGTQIRGAMNARKRDEIRLDFDNFVADRRDDIHIATAISVLMRNNCEEEAWKMCVKCGYVVSASCISSRREEIEQTLSLLKQENVVQDDDTFSQVVNCVCKNLIHAAPEVVTRSIMKGVKGRGGRNVDHIVVARGLARVARQKKDELRSKQAYECAVTYLQDVLLQGWYSQGDDTDEKWWRLAQYLFVLHGEFGTEEAAQDSYDAMQRAGKWDMKKKESKKVICSILQTCRMVGFERLSIKVYTRVGHHETAVKVACAIDEKLGEETARKTEGDDVMKRRVWMMVAEKNVDATHVVQRSDGILEIEDVLPRMKEFEIAGESVRKAVEERLKGHMRATEVAKRESCAALCGMSGVREDVEKGGEWRRWGGRGCEHGGDEGIVGRDGMCDVCGDAAIDGMKDGFDCGLRLEIVQSDGAAAEKEI